MNWNWLFWQVAAPLLGPIVLSAIVALFWWTGVQGFLIEWHVVLDLSPWAMTFFGLTLLSATMSDLWKKWRDHPALFLSLLMTSFAIALYASFIVISRHDAHFSPRYRGAFKTARGARLDGSSRTFFGAQIRRRGY
jgi:hypothetical protein